MSGDHQDWQQGPTHAAPKPEKYNWLEKKKPNPLWTLVKFLIFLGVIYEILRYMKVVH